MIYIIKEGEKKNYGINITRDINSVLNVCIKIKIGSFNLYPRMRIRKWWRFKNKVRKIYFTFNIEDREGQAI